MSEEFKDKSKDIPEMIISPFEMQEPNQSIDIFTGNFILRQNEKTIELNGEIYFDWFPNTRVNFKGKITDNSDDNISLTETNDRSELLIDGLIFGDAFLLEKSFSNEVFIEGMVLGDAIIGDKTIPVSKVNFTIPNLRDFHGELVKVHNENRVKVFRNRMVFEDDKFIITIDKLPNFNDLYKNLKNKGGYVVLYSGVLEKKQGKIDINELKGVFLCFSTFLTFLNGRRCSPVFIQGCHEGDVIWTDFSGYFVDQYKTVVSWPQKHSIEGLDNLWNTFSSLWKDVNDKDFIRSAIHWYVEANMNSGYMEGSIIMSQVALELIYNWMVIEKKRLLVGKDGESISASNKIRLLLSQVNGNSEVPKTFTNLQSFVNENNEIIDGVDTIVQIRNAIIHSQEEKRRKLTKIHYRIKYEAQQLAIWYTELSLLYIFRFKGKYFNRCSGKLWAGEGEENAPYT